MNLRFFGKINFMVFKCINFHAIVSLCPPLYKVGTELVNGSLDFARESEQFIDDPTSGVHNEQPASGSIIAFNNSLLRHCVRPLGGIGRRRLVAFHLVDPDKPKLSAVGRPRQFRRLYMRDTCAALLQVQPKGQ